MRSLLILVLGLTVVLASERNALADWRDDQRIWYDASTLAKEVIIRNLDFLYKNQQLQSNMEYSRLLFSTLDLILVLDLEETEEANHTLAELSTYGLDGGGSRYLRCAILRKGPVMIPLLRRELEKEETDCAATLGADNGVCLTSRRLEVRVDNYLQQIEDNSPCSFD